MDTGRVRKVIIQRYIVYTRIHISSFGWFKRVLLLYIYPFIKHFQKYFYFLFVQENTKVIDFKDGNSNLLKTQYPELYTTYSTYLYENRVNSILDSYEGKDANPFYMYLAIQSPHAKFAEVPKSYKDMYPPDDPIVSVPFPITVPASITGTVPIMIPANTPFTVTDRQTVSNIVIRNFLFYNN